MRSIVLKSVIAERMPRGFPANGHYMSDASFEEVTHCGRLWKKDERHADRGASGGQYSRVFEVRLTRQAKRAYTRLDVAMRARIRRIFANWVIIWESP